MIPAIEYMLKGGSCKLKVSIKNRFRKPTLGEIMYIQEMAPTRGERKYGRIFNGSNLALKGVFVLAVIHAKVIPIIPAKKVVAAEIMREFLRARRYLSVANIFR